MLSPVKIFFVIILCVNKVHEICATEMEWYRKKKEKNIVDARSGKIVICIILLIT